MARFVSRSVTVEENRVDVSPVLMRLLNIFSMYRKKFSTGVRLGTVRTDAGRTNEPNFC